MSEVGTEEAFARGLATDVRGLTRIKVAGTGARRVKDFVYAALLMDA